MINEFPSEIKDALSTPEDERKKRLTDILATQFALKPKRDSWSENRLWFYEQLRYLVENPEKLLERTTFNLSPTERTYFHESIDFPRYQQNGVNRNITFAELQSLAELYQGFMESLQFDLDQSVSIDRLLATIRCELIGQELARHALNIAISLMEEFTPAMVPENEIMILIEHVKKGEAINGAYYGKLHKKGIIAVDMIKDPFRDFTPYSLDQEMIAKIIILVHELGHAWQDEMIFASKQRTDINVDQIVFPGAPSGIVVERYSPGVLLALITKEIKTGNRKESITKGENLSLVVIEGLAVLLEIYIESEWKKKQLRVGAQERAQFIQDQINDRFKIHSEIKFTRSYDPYRIGLDLIRKLSTYFSKEQMMDVVGQIDLFSCAAVPTYSPLGLAMQEDPRLLPGLSEQQVVKDSLRNDDKLPLQENEQFSAIDVQMARLFSEQDAGNVRELEVELDGKSTSVALSNPVKQRDRFLYNAKIAGQNCVVEIPYCEDVLTVVQKIQEQARFSAQLHAAGAFLPHPCYATVGIIAGDSFPVIIRLDEQDLHQRLLLGVEDTLSVEYDLKHDKQHEAWSRNEFMQNFYPLIETLYAVAQLGLHIPDGAWGLRLQSQRLEFYIHDVSQIRKATDSSEQFSSHRAALLAGTIFTNSLSLKYREESDIVEYWFDDTYVQNEIANLHKSIKEKKQFSAQFERK